MASPTTFEKQNKIYGKPKDMAEDECGSLPVLQTTDIDLRCPCIISCWLFTDAEIEEIIKTKKVWVKTLGAGTPPLCISGQGFNELL